MAQLADQLTEEQIEQIVKRQLKKLDDEYEEVHKYDMKPQKDQGTPNVDSLKKAEEQEEEELGDYQAIGQADGDLFDDDEQDMQADSGNPQNSIKEPEVKQSWMEVMPETETENGPARNHGVDLEKVQKIANTFCLEMPQWASDPEQCRLRLQKLFNKY